MHHSNSFPHVLRAGFVALTLVVSSLGCDANAPQMPVGSFQGSIETPGGWVDFMISIDDRPDGTTTVVRCGGEEWKVAETQWDGRELAFVMPEFDAEIRAVREGPTTFKGQYRRRRGPEEWAELKFRMHPPLPTPPYGDATPFAGRWSVQFADDEEPGVAILRKTASGQVYGTILTVTGDYRYLGGHVSTSNPNEMELNAFDGGHVFRFVATLQKDGSLQGDFWSGDWYHTTWTASPDPNASLPDGFSLSQVRDSVKLDDLQFVNASGEKTTIRDVTPNARIRIVELFGTWCPNCHDATALLAELEDQYGNRGLSIVGLAFELTGDADRDQQQVKRYVSRFGVEYPILIAGLADKEIASEQFPLLTQIKAYPTFLFVNEEGEVIKTYTGFSGPATGEAHELLSRQFKETVESMLAN